MKKTFLVLCAAFALFFAHSASAAESIRTFDTRLQVQADGAMQVSETIVYDFGIADRHGIYRDIPVKYRGTLGAYSMSLSAITVADESGTAYPFTVSPQGTQQRIKIGDPNRLVTGLHTYVISYLVQGAVGFFKDHDEIYWNAVGTDWEVPIDTASAVVSLPSGIPVSQVSTECYTGAMGAKTPCESKKVDAATAVFDHVYFGQNALGPQQGLTVVVSFPKGIVIEPSATQKIINRIRDNGVVAFPIIAFIVMFWLWYARGRDPKGRGTIIAEYEAPAGLTPGQVGALIDESADNQDVSAEIIYLATKGYLKITRIADEKKFLPHSADYELIRLRSVDDALPPFERTLLEGLFASATMATGVSATVRLSDLKDKFHTTQESIKKQLYDTLTSSGYFVGQPQVVRSIYIGIGFLFVMLGIFLGRIFGALGVFSLIIAALPIVGFGWAMPKRTYQGVLAREKILGFKEFLSVTETDRLKFHNAPEKNPQLFEACLPYAMVLGVEKQWAVQFKDIYTQPPSWYNDPAGRVFAAPLFVSDLRSFTTHAGTTLSANPASGGGAGGGGFSGGGFGGGGGGSW